MPTTASSSASPAPRWARAPSPRWRSWSPKSSTATGPKSAPSSPRPTSTSAATASGARCPPAAAWACAARRTTCAAPARPRANCWSPRRRRAGRCRPAECAADKGIVTHKPSGRTLRYGRVRRRGGRKLAPAPRKVKLREPKDLGRSPASRCTASTSPNKVARQAGVRRRRRPARACCTLPSCNARCSAGSVEAGRRRSEALKLRGVEEDRGA